MQQSIGYSGTPLAKKLGIKSGCILMLIGEPAHYFDLFTDLPVDIKLHDSDNIKKDVIHFFTKNHAELTAKLPQLKNNIKPSGMIWVSWPKKSAKVETDITEDDIRNFALKIGLVDIKVCAVDNTWSGLKLVIPLKDR